MTPPTIFLQEPGKPQMPWNDWIDYFEQYSTQGRQSSLPDKEKIAMLRIYLGKMGLRILSDLKPAETYEAMTKALTDYYSPAETEKREEKRTFLQKVQNVGVVGVVGGMLTIAAGPFAWVGLSAMVLGGGAAAYAEVNKDAEEQVRSEKHQEKVKKDLTKV